MRFHITEGEAHLVASRTLAMWFLVCVLVQESRGSQSVCFLHFGEGHDTFPHLHVAGRDAAVYDNF